MPGGHAHRCADGEGGGGDRRQAGWLLSCVGSDTLSPCPLRGPGGGDLHGHPADSNHAGGVFHPDWVW